ncbi:MAG: hypothetical protein ACREQF_07495 [Candidatus Binataceae bacterium]
MMTLIAVMAGCATSPLAAARSSIARGDYVAARTQLLQVEVADLSGPEQVEVGDDLCLVDFMIGRPYVPLSSQWSTCAEAAKMGGSRSGPLLARIDETLRSDYSDEVHRALRDKDAARAARAVLSYRSTPGPDQRLVDAWTKEIWKLIEEQDLAARNFPKREVASATSAVGSAFRAERKMNDRAFAAWVAETVKVAGAPRAAIKPGRVVLSISAGAITDATRNLDCFTRVNDALSARCNCLGRTDVVVSETGLPAYLVRLDTESKRSEVVVMPRGPLQSENTLAAARLGE